MSILKTKERLVFLLGRADNRVIALSGKWGTGKTHLWKELKKESTDDKVKNALYVSLFGLSSVDEIKRKLIEFALPVIRPKLWHESLKSFFKAGITVASAHYKSLAALNDLNLVMMCPVICKDKFIVIDDIERKHLKLGIDEVLGFIDEYSNQHNVRFILILNDDQLSDDRDQLKLWSTFREKVIDEEVRLSTSPEEAIAIASEVVNSKYTNALKQAITTCGLTNIRIVSKVLKTANQILGNRDLSEAVQFRVIPSIVLLSSIHYRGLKDGPNFEFVLSISNPQVRHDYPNDIADPSKQQLLEDSWRVLLQQLGIYGCGDFENELIEYLKSGLYNSSKVQTIIDGFIDDKLASEAKFLSYMFMERAFWEHRLTNEELITEASKIVNGVKYLEPLVVTQVFNTINRIPGGQKLANEIIESWLSAYNSDDHLQVDDSSDFESHFERPLHPAIKAALDLTKNHLDLQVSLVDACLYISNNKSWGEKHVTAMNRATKLDFEKSIREMDSNHLRIFMPQMIKMCLHRGTYEEHFGNAINNFIGACRDISDDRSVHRLRAIISHFFVGTALANELHSLQMQSV